MHKNLKTETIVAVKIFISLLLSKNIIITVLEFCTCSFQEKSVCTEWILRNVECQNWYITAHKRNIKVPKIDSHILFLFFIKIFQIWFAALKILRRQDKLFNYFPAAQYYFNNGSLGTRLSLCSWFQRRHEMQKTGMPSHTICVHYLSDDILT